MEAFWKGAEDDPEKWGAFLTDFEERIAFKNNELREEHSNDGRFGMSKAGGCTRAAALKLLGYKPEPFSGSSKYTFWLGHVCEVAAVCTLDSLGYPVSGHQEPTRIDPFMHSYSDGIVSYGGRQHILSVKSTGYKKSGKQGKTWVRRGFPELPFGGCKSVQPGWWAQMQAEMHGSGIDSAILVVVAKDIVKAMEGDEYLGPNGNGSLTFYCEQVDYDREWCERHLVPAWAAAWKATESGSAGPALYLNKDTHRYAVLDRASEGAWPNKDRTGTFNPCSYCDLREACKEAK